MKQYTGANPHTFHPASGKQNSIHQIISKRCPDVAFDRDQQYHTTAY